MIQPRPILADVGYSAFQNPEIRWLYDERVNTRVVTLPDFLIGPFTRHYNNGNLPPGWLLLQQDKRLETSQTGHIQIQKNKSGASLRCRITGFGQYILVQENTTFEEMDAEIGQESGEYLLE